MSKICTKIMFLMELICLRALVFCVLVNGKVHNRIVASSFQATSVMELFKVEKLGILSQYIRTSNKEAARWCTRKTKSRNTTLKQDKRRTLLSKYNKQTWNMCLYIKIKINTRIWHYQHILGQTQAYKIEYNYEQM